MTAEETRLRKKRFSRIRRIKRILRFMPRRATIHRYPFIGWFAKEARERAYLWSFRSSDVVPAIYAGCILTLMPLYGVQIPFAVFAAIVFRTNLPVLVGLQLISNPLTVPFIYWMAFMTGDLFLVVFNDTVQLSELAQQAKSAGHLQKGIYWFSCMCVGGSLIGYFCGFILSTVYRIGEIRARNTIQRIRNLKVLKRLPHPENKEPENNSNSQNA